MFRLVFRFLLLLVLFAVIRAVISTVSRLFTQTFRQAAPPPSGPQAPTGEIGGELKQDPVCGTFVPTHTSVKKTINGELVHFCSVACRDKYKVA
jgi:YHS domain-containing protein